MKNLLFIAVMMTAFGSAAQTPKTPAPLPTTPPVAQPKMTTKDAKKTCKDLGKTGADLIQCMKDQKEEK